MCCTQPIHTTGRRSTHCMLGQAGANRRHATEQRHGRRNSQPVRSGCPYWRARGTGRGPQSTARPQGCRHARVFHGDDASATQSLQPQPARPRRQRDWPRLREHWQPHRHCPQCSGRFAFLLHGCPAQDIRNLLCHEQLQRMVRSPTVRARVRRLDALVLCLVNPNFVSDQEAAEKQFVEHMSQ